MDLRKRIEALEKTKEPDEVVAALKAEILQRDPDADVSECVDIVTALAALADRLPN